MGFLDRLLGQKHPQMIGLDISSSSVKLVELTWNCSRGILGVTANSESMQSAKIVLRKK